MIYVVAGNHEQAYQYVNRKIEERIRNGEQVSKVDDYTYVRDVMTLRGVSNPRGVFIGTWEDRPDIRDIVQQLMISQDNSSPVLVNIWKKINKKPNKLTPVSGGWVNESLAISNAAGLLAQAIDDEVLAQTLKKINGGMNG